MDSRDREILEDIKRELVEAIADHTYRFNEPEPEIRRKVPAPYVKIEVNLGEDGQ